MASASKSGAYLLIGNSIGKALNFLALFICTPYLGPEGFGNLLIVSIILAIFSTLVEIGFEHFYIIKINLNGPNRSDEETIDAVENTVFLVRMVTALILFFFQIAVSYLLLGKYFESPTDIFLRILALNYIFSIFGKINEVRLKKRLQFNRLTRAKALGDFFAAGLKVLLVVFFHLGIIGWAWGTVCGQFAYSLMLVFHGEFKPKWQPIPIWLRDEVKWFAKHSWLIGVGMFLQNHASNILLKATYSLTTVGHFQFANSYSLDLQNNIIAPQSHLMVPYFSNYKHDTSRLLDAMIRMGGVFFFLLGPGILFGLIYADILVPLVFDNLWMDAIPLLRILLSFCFLRLIFSPALGLLAGFGKMAENTRITFIATALLILSLGTCYLLHVHVTIYVSIYVANLLFVDLLKAKWGLSFISISLVTFVGSQGKFLIGLFSLAILLLAARFLAPELEGISLLIPGVALIMLFYMIHWLTRSKTMNDLLQTMKQFRAK